ncbi:MAG: hypothetical protein AAFQ02_07860 [Bacteroidota bacterium]
MTKIRYDMTQPGKIGLALLLIFLSISSIRAQEFLDWDQIGMVSWKEEYDASLGYDVTIGEYDERIMAIEGKDVIVKGYVIPLDALGISYALSRTSFASCFFCGEAGPETVMELRVPPKSIAPDRLKNTLLTFQGRFQIRISNEKGLHYVLLNATEK